MATFNPLPAPMDVETASTNAGAPLIRPKPSRSGGHRWFLHFVTLVVAIVGSHYGTKFWMNKELAKATEGTIVLRRSRPNALGWDLFPDATIENIGQIATMAVQSGRDSKDGHDLKAFEGVAVLTNFPSYPAYSGPFKPEGIVTLGFDGEGSVAISYNIRGYDPRCEGIANTSGVANRCGIHIHVGKVCPRSEEANIGSTVGGHYWNNGELAEDPWTYGGFYNGAKGTLNIHHGYNYDSSVTRAFVIHNFNGARVSCSLIAAHVALNEFEAYPGYTGKFAPKGEVLLTFLPDGTVSQRYKLSGMDPRCTAPNGTLPNSCGIHIHQGTSCSNHSAVGGHYWNSVAPNLMADPWTYNAPYLVQEAQGKASKAGKKAGREGKMAGRASGNTVVYYGHTFESSVGRTFVLHDWEGTRVSCTLLDEGTLLGGGNGSGR